MKPMTLRQRIVDTITKSTPGVRWTNADLADALKAPLPSIRRASLQAMLRGEIMDGGPVTYNLSVVTYVAPLTAD